MVQAGPVTGLVAGRADITLAGWQTDPQLRWSFQHVADMFPTAEILPADKPFELPRAHAAVERVPVTHPATGVELTFGEVMSSTVTDGWIVAVDGRVLQESYPMGMAPETRHLLMSVSKSVVGAVVGALVDRGVLDVGAPLTRYVPALVGTGYDGATVRQLLDMRSGIRFSEEYLDPMAEVRLLEQAIGWAPRTRPDLPDTLAGFLATLQRARAHGGGFEYRSCETDVLGWVCEEATGTRMAELVSDLVWRPIGAEFPANISTDSTGMGMFDGGISAALRDLVRFGSVFLDDGTAFSGERVLSADWIGQTLAGDPDSDVAFSSSKDAVWMPGGMYRNQMWFPSKRRDVLACLGIHGQLIYIDRTARLVGAKLSSWPTPQDPDRLFSTLAAFGAVAAVDWSARS